MKTNYISNGISQKTIDFISKMHQSNDIGWHIINCGVKDKVEFLYHNVYFDKKVESVLFGCACEVLNESGYSLKNIIHISAYKFYGWQKGKEVVEDKIKNKLTLIYFSDNSSGSIFVEENGKFKEYPYKKGAFIVFDSNTKHYFTLPKTKKESQTILKIVFEDSTN